MGLWSQFPWSCVLLSTLITPSLGAVITARPGSAGAVKVPEIPGACRAVISPIDYSAKNRRDHELPVCSADNSGLVVARDNNGIIEDEERELVPASLETGVSLIGRTELSSLFGRQVVGGDDYTCGPDRPCKNKACCPKATGQCNYGEKACGTSGISPNEVCWSNCDAKAECGKNAAIPGQKCPLNVCCGKWGFCGMTKDFCDKEDHGATGGCQSNCDQPGPKNKASDQLNRVIGYYEAWRHDSKCQDMGLDDIPVNSLTHLYFSFAFIQPDFQIVGMDNLPDRLFTDFTNLKKKNPALKMIIAIGGWTHNDPGPLQKVFSNMVSTKANRSKFIGNLMSFLRMYAFDGVDFDWEYPGADDRGGVPEDGVNFTQFLKELQEENKKQPVKYIVSYTAPTSFWYLRHFDLKSVQYTDFVNVMSYENDVPANKLNMGLGFYGRAFQLADPSCNKPGCLFKGGATKGACSGESGILSYREIQEIIKNKKIKPIHDKQAGVKYITWNTDQWVSFDDKETFKQKKDMAAKLGLGGYLIWAIDQDDAEMTALASVLDPKPLGDFKSIDKGDENWTGTNDKCYITKCGVQDCPSGEIKITDQKCGKNQKSALCCPLSGAPDPKSCTWRGGATRWCNGYCKDDEVMTHMSNGELPLTFSGTVLDILDDVAKIILRIVGRAYPLAALTGLLLVEVLEELDIDTKKLYCCPEKEVSKWKNCAWYGKPGNCFDGHCPDMKTVQITDSYFGGSDTCGIHADRVRTFCCESDGEPLFLPTDKTSDGGDDNPNDAAFQFVVLVSPEALQISLDKRDGSNWDVFDCNDSISEGEHTVRMMPKGCGPGKYAVAKSMTPAPGSTSDHVKLLPRHLSHLASLEPVVYELTFDYDFHRVPRDMGNTQMRIDYSNQDDYWKNIVAGSATRKRDVHGRKRLAKRTLEDVGGNPVRWLEEEFRDDFHFDKIAPRDLQERWFGKSILDWLAALVVPEIKREFTHKYDDSVTAKLFDESWNCPGTVDGVNYDGHLLGQAVLDIEVESSFGFTLIVESLTLPLNLEQSYLTFYNKGRVTGVVTLEALARVTYEQKEVILNLPFPGASFKIPGIGTIGPQLTVEGSIDASLGMAGLIETKLEIAKWEVRQVMPDTNSYKPELIDNSKPSLDRTGDFSGIKKPEFYAGVTASGDVSFKLSAAAEFGVRFDPKWKVDPAAAAVVGEVSLKTKFAAGVSTTATCPFTYGLDIGARLFARATAPKTFGWAGGEVNLTDPWEKTIIKGGTCPNLGPIPSKRSIQDCSHLLIEGSSEENDSIHSSGTTLLTRHISGGYMSSLVKRGGVYGPALTLNAGEYFCPSKDGEKGITCKEAYAGLAESNEGGIWTDAKHKREVLAPTSTIDENAIAAHFHAHQERSHDHGHHAGSEALHMFDKRAKEKLVQACDRACDISGDFPPGGQLNGFDWGWVDPEDCSNFNFGDPLQARAAGVQYHTEHVLEAQMIDLFFKYLDKKKSKQPDPKPGAAQGATVSFCDYVNELWDVPPFVWPNEDTTGGVGKAWNPIMHIAAQYPTRTYKKEEFIALESAINTPSKTSAWAGNNPWNYGTWANDIPKYAEARVILQKMRSTMGSRLYQSHSTIQKTMKTQTDRIGKILDALDTTLLPANRRPGYAQWSKQNLKSEWLTYMRGQYTKMMTQTNSLITKHLQTMVDAWTTQAEKDKWKDLPNQSAAKLKENKEHRDFIKAIEDFKTKWNSLPAWNNPL
ncbi:glycoside hydrolase family 18 protein [Bipolaris maydis ATCC 48331]|uniref:chitinase n=1 Tax=Cochliobolus heterostrophus (strain C4 / ATCC 48331 / race T) TaxID=665024 RepID=N4X2T0_COCH4|nr:glycoside hydrolase family 18 protein [Bipolaris maydis ATCC 48331]KAJ5043209.1 glycosyl hydrolases family 18-domain-containing protein [Bipolaris maydis]ENH99491.1 glycoside hydrolase family 18 protein [Bipolaris maydis ATCC 48331]KAJ5058041.1 glycosyl hydrolases family 18-domain-containing protein [Bipolaris maydis]KAJ6195287.1 glycosyl hydrolases family 18-domain-containing protein [Bipolaris maydis]KAJ6206057.1 glycoside hydrolase family 18 protein [Bipolaris maydis]